jgi:hypothetical protein
MGYCGEGRGVEKIKAILDEEPRLVKAETRDWRLGKGERKTRSWILDEEPKLEIRDSLEEKPILDPGSWIKSRDS